MDLLTISAFARLSHLSPKALRLYDELRLLPPVHVDPDSGYRWYSRDQLPRARQVALLRRLDMPLAVIQRLLDLPPEAAARELADYREAQEQGMAAKRALAVFLIDELTGKRSIMYEVLIRELPARILLTATEHLTADRVVDFAGRMYALVAEPGCPVASGEFGRPFLRYHGEISQDSDGPVEFCCPVTDAEDAAGRFPGFTVRTEPAGRQAYVNVPKSDLGTPIAFESLRQWMSDRNEPIESADQTFLREPETVGAQDTVYEIGVRLS